MSKTILALLLALSVSTIYAQGTNRQSEYQNPPSTKGSGTSRADIKAEERASGSMGTRQSEYSDPVKRRKGQAATNDGAPTNDAFAKSRDEKAAARSAYKKEKSKDRAAYKQSKKESTDRLRASNERPEAGKNLEVPR